MLIRYLSDLHLEFLKPQQLKKFIHKFPLPKQNEICILAGDIGNPYQPNYDEFMKFISKNFVKTFIIPGNHEYYNKTKTMDETNIFLEKYFQAFGNIRLLNNNYEIYEGDCFIGSILWSKITNPDYPINDVYNIPNFDHVKYNRLNRTCIDFLEDTINKNDNCIIITHHIPSEKLIDKKYRKPSMLPYNQWFYCDMDNFIFTHQEKIKC